MSTTQPKKGLTVVRGLEKLSYEFEDTGVVIVYKRIPIPIFKNFVRECMDTKTKVIEFDTLFMKCFAFAVLTWENVFEETESGESIPCPCIPENYQYVPMEIQAVITAKACEHIAGDKISEHVKRFASGGVQADPLAEPPTAAETQVPTSDSPSGLN